MTKTEQKAQFSVNAAAILIYLGYRLLGASKEHAWKEAKTITVNAVMDKAIEVGGIRDPRHKGKDGIQAYFVDGGPMDGCTRFVETCGAVKIPQDMPEAGDEREHIYLRTEEMRGQQTVFRYEGLQKPAMRASEHRKAGEPS